MRSAPRCRNPAPSAPRSATTFSGRGWRIRGPSDAAPGVTRFIDQTSLFMTLVGLTSLLVGGIGVANGVRAWLDARARTIATLRCLGASSGLVLAVCLIQVLRARRLRHRRRAAGWRPGPDRAGRLAEGRAAGAPRTRPLSGPASARRLLRPADGARLLAVAARPGGAHPRRGTVPRRADPGTHPSVAAIAGGKRRRRGGSDRADRRHRDRPALRTVVLRRRARNPGAVPPRRQSADAGGTRRFAGEKSRRGASASATCTGRARPPR